LKMYAAIGRSYATAGLIFMVESQNDSADRRKFIYAAISVEF